MLHNKERIALNIPDDGFVRKSNLTYITKVFTLIRHFTTKAIIIKKNNVETHTIKEMCIFYYVVVVRQGKARLARVDTSANIVCILCLFLFIFILFVHSTLFMHYQVMRHR